MKKLPARIISPILDALTDPQSAMVARIAALMQSVGS